MNLSHRPLPLKVLTVVFSPATLLATSLVFSMPSYGLEFPPTGGAGAPGRTAGGGMRGSACTTKGTPLTALVPGDGVNTLAGNRATLFVYVPTVGAVIKNGKPVVDTRGNKVYPKAELTVTDEMGNDVGTKEVALTGKPGVLQVSLPEKATLQPNKKYFWEFAIVCDAEDRTKDQVVQGLLQRVQLSSEVQTALKGATPLKQAELYAKAKIWQETLVTAAQLRNTNPKAWEDLLNSVGLKALAKEPFIALQN
jgi:hypothetical protein